MYGYQEFAEQQKRRKIIIALAIACVLVGLLSAGLNFYVRHLHTPQVIPVFAPVVEMPGSSPVIATNVVHEIFSYIPGRQTRLIPLCWSAGIFYDTVTRTIPLPYGAYVVSTTQNAAYYIHEIELAGVYLPRKSGWVRYIGTFLMHKRQDGSRLYLRTRGPVIPIYFNNGYYSYVRLVGLRELYHTIVVIDPGHGGHDTGARNVLGRARPQEADIVLAISQKLLDYFDEPGVLLVPTRTADEFVDLDVRYRIANFVADYFISIHTNADDRSRQSRGMLTLYGNAPGSDELAYMLQTAMMGVLGGRDRGISHAPQFRILRNSVVPVALLELLFLSNPDDAARMSDPATQYLIARAIGDVIRELARKNYDPYV